MASDLATDNQESKKRVLEDSVEDEGSKPKKAKVYSAKQFRKQIQTTEKLSALKEFLSLLTSGSKHDHILDYLKNGGNCLELLQTLESDSSVPPSLVFDLVIQILLGITAKYGQYYSSAYESCRYLINNYLPVIHKMLGLSSSKEERKVCLKLLTAMAALSSNLAKDILVNVKFHTTNIELLTKHTAEKNSVRDCFVHFLTAFLVDSDAHTLSILLEKSGMLTCIISGLQYDNADTVCIVITAMKNHILENPSVMKTIKMHVFNTAIVKDIVNLYNWKGPQGLKALEKNNKTIFEVDKLAKSKVSECVHDFLLVLCTSHRSGVIFRDQLIGLGKKNMNSLMYTVLDSLDRPWEHSYASELVIKICRSCPDLTKTMWLILKPYLEPRLTEKWLNAMQFATKLIEELEPLCIEYCAKDLSPQQLAQIIEILVSPAPILKTLLVDNKPNEKDNTKSHVMKLLHCMLEKISIYLAAAKRWTNANGFSKISQYLSNYVARHYPNAQNLLKDWNDLYLNQGDEKHANQEYLEIILDILNFYKIIAPQLLYNLTSDSLDFSDFLLKLSSNSEEIEVMESLQIKMVSIFVDIDYSYFLPKTDIFAYIVPLLLKTYHKERDKKIESILFKLLRNTGIFDNNLYEINIWLNGIFNFKTFTEQFAKDFVLIVKNTTENMLEYQEKLSQITDGTDLTLESEEFIQTLLIASESEDYYVDKMRHRYLSPMILGLCQYYAENNDYSKNFKKYAEFSLFNLFHNQTNPQRFVSVIMQHQDAIPTNVFNYFSSWAQGENMLLSKAKGLTSTFKDIGELFLNASLNSDLLKENIYPDFLSDILKMVFFYFSSLVTNGSVSRKHVDNLLFLVKHLVAIDYGIIVNDSCIELLLGNPCLIKYFNINQLGKGTPSDIATRALLEAVVELNKTPISLHGYMHKYSGKIFQDVCKILKNPKKRDMHKETLHFLQIFGLSYQHCLKITSEISLLPVEVVINERPVFIDLLVYSLGRILILCKENPNLPAIDGHVLTKVTSILATLNNENKSSSIFFTTLKEYFEYFPHNISNIHENLFSSILLLAEYNKEAVDLAVFLLERNLKLLEEVQLNITSVCEKKGLILPIIHILINNGATTDQILEDIYKQMEASILKAIQKPQKVGQHFAKDYDVARLIEKFMPLENCTRLIDKVQKFDVAEVFHAKLLAACYNKAIKESDINEKQLNNIIMTFIHLQITAFKRKVESEDEIRKTNELSTIFANILDQVHFKMQEKHFTITDSFRTYSKFALKFGVSGQYILLTILRKLVLMIGDDLKEDGNSLLDMLLSHSEFLNSLLSEHSDTKLEILKLLLTLCGKRSELIEKSHVAIVLSAYRGMVTKCDRTVLALLKLYESQPDKSRFYDFKPFLWGRAAAAHYSVRAQIGNSLTRQPKISDVLGILKEDLVNSTITNYLQKYNLHEENDDLSTEDFSCYDLKFLLPLFSHILAPEQQVRTYIFIRKGALSLTVLGLACQDKEVRQAACHVLARLHFHLEARQTGKDNLLWIRFVEALCKGVAVLPNFKLNSFSAIFFARMALILTNPKHVMYSPLSLYLTAKQELDLSTVPELYTLLFSADVNYKEHRQFILDILRDGMKSEKDFLDFLKSMGYKLFSELLTSCLSDSECKLSILDILSSICKISLGVKILTDSYSFLAQLDAISISHTAASLPKLFDIFLSITKIKQDKFTNQIIFDMSLRIFESNSFPLLKDQDVERFYEIIYNCCLNDSAIVKDKSGFIDNLTVKINDRFCNYLKSYGCRFVNENCPELQEKHRLRFLRLLVYKFLM